MMNCAGGSVQNGTCKSSGEFIEECRHLSSARAFSLSPEEGKAMEKKRLVKIEEQLEFGMRTVMTGLQHPGKLDGPGYMLT